MNKFRLTIKLLAIATFMLAFASLAQAQATRTWVSGVGDDANPCSRTAPCKTFAGAISKTAPGGEISALDPGGFGALTITKSISVNGEGTLAGILNASVNGIIINAATTDNIVLRNISIYAPASASQGLNGIRVLAAKNVTVDNLTIANVSGNGIDVAAGANCNVYVVNSRINNCAGAGIRADTSTGIARVTVKNSSFVANGEGISGRRNSRISVYESSISFNSIGVHAESNLAATSAVVFLKGCHINNNTSHGIQAGGGIAVASSVVRITDNLINNNAGAGVSIGANGSVETFLNNEINANNPDGCVGCVNITGTLN
ncbi:MAG: right-handed parallel beta-helix repeat-containing protein [Acidobacteriota bacterium]